MAFQQVLLSGATIIWTCGAGVAQTVNETISGTVADV
jgi:hypothetical protein